MPDPIPGPDTCASEACAIQTAAGVTGLRDGSYQVAQNGSARTELRGVRWTARWIAQSCAEQVCASGAALIVPGLRDIRVSME